MTECDEVAQTMQNRFNSYFSIKRPSFSQTIAWIKTQMPDETYTIRDNIAASLFDNWHTNDLDLSLKPCKQCNHPQSCIDNDDCAKS